MPLPVNYDKVAVRGTYVYLDGTAAQGKVKFTGKPIMISESTSTIILPNTITATLAGGEFEVQIPATDDPDILPGGWTYKVEEAFDAGGGRTFELDIPLTAQSGGIDLSRVAVAAPPQSGDPTAFVTLSAFEAHVNEGAPDVTWSDVTDRPSTFPPSTHNHAVMDVSGLQSLLDAKAAASHGHAVMDVSGLQSLLDAKAAASHGHATSEITGLDTALAGKAASSHTHTTANVTGLDAALAGKAASSHTHTTANVTGLDTALAGKHDTSRTLAVADAGEMMRTNLTYAVTISSPDYEQVSVNGTVVCWRNEVAFLRGTPHADYKDDALVRGVRRSDLTTENGGYVELQNAARDQILHRRSWRTGDLWRGNGTAAAVRMSDSLVLGAADSVPAGTPANTLIYRTA